MLMDTGKWILLSIVLGLLLVGLFFQCQNA